MGLVDQCDAWAVLAALTGLGLATSAGLNAYIPLLAVGLLTRYTDLIVLPDNWHWLSDEWMLVVLAVLLAVEVVADKVPTVDHINDVVQTVVRPTSGGLAFGATSSASTLTVNDPSTFFHDRAWVPVAVGIAISLAVHLMKATSRVAINAATFGIGAPIASVAEDVTSVVVSVVAIILPALVLVLIIALGLLMVRGVRRIRSRTARQRTAPS